MRTSRLLLAGLSYHARALAGVIAGCAIATAVLSGALVVGDSVRGSLRNVALERIGSVDTALVAHDRFFRADLGDSLAFAVPGLHAAPVLALDGVALVDGGARRVNDAHVYGIDDRFLDLASEPIRPRPLLRPDQALVNTTLARRLGVGVGDAITVRVEKPSGLPRDMALATTDDMTVPLRYEVSGVLGDAAFGRFALAANQVPPAGIFVARTHLAERLELRGRANLLLANADGSEAGDLASALNGALPHVWSLDDGELELVKRPERGVVELRSRRVFIDPVVEEAIRALAEPAIGILTYFVNAIEHDDAITPYSTVTAVGALGADAQVPISVEPGGIVLTDWCADDLGSSTGDAVDVRAFVIGAQRRLEEKVESFRVTRVIPIEGFADDPGLMPAFPGLADSEHCREWEAGIPIDLSLIRDRDEAYWNEHKGTPKAFIALADGQRLWRSRFGALTAVRVPLERAEDFGEAIRAAVPPSALGLTFQDVRTPALAASGGTTDFGGLFIGLSLFLIASAVALTALLFAFSVEARAGEVGLLLAVGFRPRAVRRIFLGEAVALAAIGVAVGTIGAVVYARLVLGGLGGVWAGAVGGVRLDLLVRPTTLAAGGGGAALIALGAIWVALRRQARRPAAELLRPGAGSIAPARAPTAWRGRARTALAVLGTLGALGIALSTDPGRGPAAAGAFFGAGALLLLAGLASCAVVLDRLARGSMRPVHSIGGLGVRSAARRPGRSLAVILLVAGGSFMVVAVGANRLGAPPDPTDRSSGTGGFTLLGTSTLAVLHDPASADGIEAYGLDTTVMADVDVVALRLRDGDEASCLNLNVAQQPRLLGVAPSALAERGAFTFVSTIRELPEGTSPWSMLDDTDGDVVPAIGDQNSLLWALHKKVGDSIEYVDERGQPFRVRIVGAVANSILQGNLVIGREAFEERFPSEAGARMLLVDAPLDRSDDVATALGRGLSDLGLAMESTADRLAAFNAVQNTYLLIFQMLGGLGLLLGSAGLAVVVLRNVLERRAELAALRAIGWRRSAVRALVVREHLVLLGLGLLVGVVAAGLAVLPAMRGPGLDPPWAVAVIVVAAVAVGGTAWTWLAAWGATRRDALAALRAD